MLNASKTSLERSGKRLQIIIKLSSEGWGGKMALRLRGFSSHSLGEGPLRFAQC